MFQLPPIYVPKATRPQLRPPTTVRINAVPCNAFMWVVRVNKAGVACPARVVRSP